MNYREDLKKVKAFIFDVDGVFSKESFYLHPSGEFIRSMNAKDGYATQFAVKQNYLVGIITGAKTESVRSRFKGLGITDIYLASSNKWDDYQDFLFKYSLKPEEILYMGDDIPDLQVMMNVGMPACPADAVFEIKQISKYISDKNGGDGCVRDVIEKVLKIQLKWHDEPMEPTA